MKPRVLVFQAVISLALAGQPAFAEGKVVVVNTSVELQSALVPENAGKLIIVLPHAASHPYVVTTTLNVPDGATVTGLGIMLRSNGLPAGFLTGTRTHLKADPALVGDLMTLAHGAVIRGLAIEDVERSAPANLGSIVVVGARKVDDVVSAAILDCEIENPNGSGVAPNGPNGRSVLVVARNYRLPDQPPFTGSELALVMAGTLIHAPGGGSGVFAVNFAAESHVEVTLIGNIIGGGLDSNGGVSRPDLVHDSSVSITSRGNLYRADSEDAFLGLGITGGSGPPVPFIRPPGPTERNSLSMVSVDDRVEGFFYGVFARGASRYTDGIFAGPSNDNELYFEMRHGKISSKYADVSFAGVRNYTASPAGNGNHLRVLMRNVTGSGLGEPEPYDDEGHVEILYGHQMGDVGPVPPELEGEDNTLEIIGTQDGFAHSNPGIFLPPAEFFTF